MAKVGEKFYIDARGIKAQGGVTENGFVLLAGSEIRPKIANYLNKTLVDLRHQCESDGTIVDWKMTRDMEFSSPSTAAYFLFGANASGLQTWKDENGMTMLEHDKLASGVFKEATDREYLGFLKRLRVMKVASVIILLSPFKRRKARQGNPRAIQTKTVVSNF